MWIPLFAIGAVVGAVLYHFFGPIFIYCSKCHNPIKGKVTCGDLCQYTTTESE